MSRHEGKWFGKDESYNIFFRAASLCTTQSDGRAVAMLMVLLFC
jgi:hypothetical protein